MQSLAALEPDGEAVANTVTSDLLISKNLL